MKVEDFFRLIYKEVLGVNVIVLDKHFKEFRKSHRQFPLIIDSLEQEVVDSAGNFITNDNILLLVEELKKKKTDSPKEFWESFTKSQIQSPINLINLFLQEIGTQLRFAIICYKNYLIAKNETDTEMVFLHIHHFLIHTANVDKLIDKLLIPSASIIARLVSQIIDLDDIELKSFRTARNHFEHFEERLDAWFYLYAGSPILDLNLVNAKTKGLPEERSLRLLRTDEDLFVILGEKFDLSNLYCQVCLLEGKVSASLDIVCGMREKLRIV